ncbi:MAG: TonB C-terminal domain-containing protein [Acidobacteria bacterium]|nr:TonB C-terminal domain-containing protein [Acidobacteriota bacterium]
MQKPNGQPTTDNQQPTTDNQQQTTDYGLPTTDYELRTTGNRLRTTDYGLQTTKLSLLLSILFHVVGLALLIFWFHSNAVQQMVAAGEGEGGEGGGGAIEVGVAEPSAILGFAKPQPVAFIGKENNPVNNARLETARPEDANDEALLPPTDKAKPNPDAIKTDRPVAPQQEKIFTGKEERGQSPTPTTQLGRSYGSPTPATVGGVGIGSGGGSGIGTGLPGGSAYGRLIQQIFSRNYNPPTLDAAETQYVIILVKIARDGTIRSIANGRVAPAYIKQRSTNALVNNAAERAILAANPLPAFPAGFLSNAQEAVAEVWFRYPK